MCHIGLCQFIELKSSIQTSAEQQPRGIQIMLLQSQRNFFYRQLHSLLSVISDEYSQLIFLMFTAVAYIHLSKTYFRLKNYTCHEKEPPLAFVNQICMFQKLPRLISTTRFLIFCNSNQRVHSKPCAVHAKIVNSNKILYS